jgi:hypothetical protein
VFVRGKRNAVVREKEYLVGRIAKGAFFFFLFFFFFFFIIYIALSIASINTMMLMQPLRL